MALASINITIGQALGEGRYSSSLKNSTVPAFPATATVAADIAVLVADGASPTQGHVNTLNTDWATFIAAYTPAGVTGDVSVVWNGATITHRNQLRAALKAALAAVDAGYGGLAE